MNKEFIKFLKSYLKNVNIIFLICFLHELKIKCCSLVKQRYALCGSRHKFK